MSSILDALNKVEQDQIEEDELISGEVDAATAARYLYGSAARKRRAGAKHSSLGWKAATGAFGLIVLTAVVCASLVMLGVIPSAYTGMTGGAVPSPGTRPGTTEPASHSAQAAREPLSVQGEVRGPGPGAVAMPSEAATGPVPLVETPQPMDTQALQHHMAANPMTRGTQPMAPRAPVPRVTEAARHHAPGLQAPSMVGYPEVPRDLPPVRQEERPVPTQDPAAEPSGAASLPEDLSIRSLPRLTPSEQARLGLPRLEVGLVGMPSAHRQPSAMINFNKVYVNEFIPGTRVRLVAVDIYGVAVEHNSRFYFLAIRG